MVNRQLQDILKHVEHPEDDDEVREYLRRILRKQAGDGSGPVSYTHLDVYKRQRIVSLLHCIITQFIV